jgi:hypothetical protein
MKLGWIVKNRCPQIAMLRYGFLYRNAIRRYVILVGRHDRNGGDLRRTRDAGRHRIEVNRDILQMQSARFRLGAVLVSRDISAFDSGHRFEVARPALARVLKLGGLSPKRLGCHRFRKRGGR